MSCIFFFLMTIMTMHGDMMMLGVWCANGVRMLCEECAKNIIHVEACVGMYVGMLASPARSFSVRRTPCDIRMS